mgnify:CR=1 FL=1
MHYPFEPYRIKAVEPIPILSREARIKRIEEARYNLFLLKAEHVTIDFLTDSGTGAMSAAQWAALQQGDESYAGARSFSHFISTIRSYMPFKHIFPAHQGRAAEHLLFSVVMKPGFIVPNNTHFDTTRGNVEYLKGEAVDIGSSEGMQASEEHPFKGNMDCDRLRNLLEKNADLVPLVMITVTDNASGGQPVSMENIRTVKAICDEFNKPLFIDACRFAENAYFIKTCEPGYEDHSIESIVREMFSYADGMTMSAKKDCLVNIGGWVACNNDAWAQQIEDQLILFEGFPTYGGLAGRDLDAIAVGLTEVMDEAYLRARVGAVAYFADALEAVGVPVIRPPGGHAVFVDALACLPHVDALAYPGQALAVSLYVEGGVRSVEVGTVMFGKQPDGTEKPAKRDWIRLALPRRVYTQSHLDYTVDVFKRVLECKDNLKGFRIVREQAHLRHFTAHFEPIKNS